jgi:hypothetical protein
MLHEILDQSVVVGDHISNTYMVSGLKDEGELAVYGTGPTSAQWIMGHPKIHVEAVIENKPEVSSYYSIPVIGEKDIAAIQSTVILLLVPDQDREKIETRLLNILDHEKVIVYPEELEEITNPIPEKAVPEG